MKNGSRELILRPKSSSDKKIELVMQCSKNANQINISGTQDCYKAFDLSNLLKDEPLGAWKKITMPFSCLNNDSVEISSITSRAKLATTGDWVVDIHSIKFINNREIKTCKLLSENYE